MARAAGKQGSGVEQECAAGSMPVAFESVAVAIHIQGLGTGARQSNSVMTI